MAWRSEAIPLGSAWQIEGGAASDSTMFGRLRAGWVFGFFLNQETLILVRLFNSQVGGFWVQWETRVMTQDMNVVMEQVCGTILAGLERGLESSEALSSLAKALDAIAERLEWLENRVQEQSSAISELEKRLEEGSPEKVQELAPAPRPIIPPSTPPANQSPSFTNLPFGLSSEPQRKSMPKRRSRTPARPTVIYRKDPRAAPRPESSPLDFDISPKASEKKAPVSLAKADDQICSEPGCDRPVRSRGLCSLHYQRVRYKERKIENKEAIDSVIPPPPPPRLPAQKSSRKKQGGIKGIFALLYEERGRRTLAGLINQMKLDRKDLVDRMNKQFADMPGVPLEEEDVLRAVHYHKLGDSLRQKEGEIICRHLTKQRGSLVKAAQKLKLDFEKLRERIEELELKDEVARIRNDFREHVLERSTFLERLDLALTREKYLKDLGIEKEVDLSLRDELEQQIELLEEDAGADQAERSIREALDLDDQRYRRLIRRFELGVRLGISELELEGEPS